MNYLEKSAKKMILNSKMTHFHHFGQNMKFLDNPKVALNHFLMPVTISQEPNELISRKRQK